MIDPGLIVLLLVVLIPLAAWLAARWPAQHTAAAERWLDGAAAPVVLGLISGLTLWWTWGSLHPVEVIHDETAYLLQAAMLAHGRMAGPPRPLPEFFEQFQVFASPVLAAKYPPGFALALLPGIWLGLPGLMPVMMIGLSGGLIFALARRLAGSGVALLAWLCWLLAPGSIPFRHLIMSETLTTTLWLGGWWALLEWRQQGSARWLVIAAGLGAWCLLTRPLTGLAYVVPLGIAAITIAARRGWMHQLPAAMAVGAGVLSILLWQNRVVTGSWGQTAWTHYTAVYAPSDHFGFGVDSTPPQRSLPPDFQDYVWYYGEFHKGFEPANLPAIFVERSTQVLQAAWGPAVPIAAVLAGLGLAASGPPLLLATGTALLLLLVHLGFAHPAEWSIYYEETLPILAILTALGTARVIGLIGARVRREAPQPGADQRTVPALLLLSAVLVLYAPSHLTAARLNDRLLSEYHRQFRRRVVELPGRTIVFVRYAKNHIFHRSLISNPADLADARSWIVYDRGVDNARLERIAPDRVSYLYIERGDSLRLLTPGDTLTTR
ncbi:MAG: hypothetical protein ABJC74_05235 [Gemmatimonadota bacterium]